MKQLFEFDEHIGDWRVLVQSKDIQDAAIQTRHIAPEAVTTDKIHDEAVTTPKIPNGAVTTPKIADEAVTTPKIPNGNVTTPKIADEAVTTEKIPNGNVTTPKIADEAVTTPKIANEAITTEKIPNGNVTTPKIADEAVTTPKIANEAITTEKIPNGNVTTPKIADEAVTEQKLAPQAVTMEKLAPEVISELQNITDAVPTKDSVKPMQSGGVLLHGSALDISELCATENPHTPAKFENLSAALTALAALPSTYKTGGMIIKFILDNALYSVVKTEGLETEPTGTELSEDPDIASGTYTPSQLSDFSTLPTTLNSSLTYYMEVVGDTTTYTTWVITCVHTSDNNYVQYRYMLSYSGNTTAENNKFANPANWQGVDDEPVAGSNNLVKSGGILDKIIGVFGNFEGEFTWDSAPSAARAIVGTHPYPAGTTVYFSVFEKFHSLNGNQQVRAYYTDGTDSGIISVETNKIYQFTTEKETSYFRLYMPYSSGSNFEETGDVFLVTADSYDILLPFMYNIIQSDESYGNRLKDVCEVIIKRNNKISISISGKTSTIAIPESTIISVNGVAYAIPSDTTVTFTDSTSYESHKLLFNTSTKEFRGASRQVEPDANEVVVLWWNNSYVSNLGNGLVDFPQDSSLRDINVLDVPLTFGEDSHYYISTSGAKTAADTWNLSDPISVTKGSTLCLRIHTTNTKVANIAIVTEVDGQTVYTPAIIIPVSGSGYYQGYYYATETCNVVISSRFPSYDTLVKIDTMSFLTPICKQVDDNRKGVDDNRKGVDELKDSIYMLPQSWQNRVMEMNILKKSMFSFLVQTDTHYYVGKGINFGNDVSKFTNLVPVNFISNLGDIVKGNAEMTLDSYRNAMLELIPRYVQDTKSSLFLIHGNHDNNNIYAATLPTPADGYVFNDELYNWIGIWPKNMDNAIKTVGTSLYGYRDYDEHSIRVIYLDTSDSPNILNVSSFAVSAEQKAWLRDVALNTTYKVIVLSHCPLISDIRVESYNWNSQVGELCTIIENFHNDNNPQHIVLGCFCGHIHEDAQKLVNGINHISFKNGDTANMICIDEDNEKIKIYSLGYSNDREYSY